MPCPNDPSCGEVTRAEIFAGIWCACERTQPSTDTEEERTDASQ